MPSRASGHLRRSGRFALIPDAPVQTKEVSAPCFPTDVRGGLVSVLEAHSVAGPLDTIRERSTLLKEIKSKYWWDEDTMWTAWSDSQMRD
jgi:hypothetical protein